GPDADAGNRTRPRHRARWSRRRRCPRARADRSLQQCENFRLRTRRRHDRARLVDVHVDLAPDADLARDVDPRLDGEPDAPHEPPGFVGLEVVDVRSHAVRGTVDRVPGSMNEVVAEPPVADDPACGVVQLVPLHVAACGECILDVLHCGLTGITHGLEDLARPRGNAVTQVRHPRLVGVYHVVGLLRPEVEENDIALLELRAAALELVVRVCGADTVRGDGVGGYP